MPPYFREVNLTPEEQEALRKKEERKDKLHQNYLCRKASGAQKRYDDKIKAAKKAEIDAKKAGYCQRCFYSRQRFTTAGAEKIFKPWAGLHANASAVKGVM